MDSGTIPPEKDGSAPLRQLVGQVDWLGRLSALILLMAGIAYGVGFIVLNFYLYKYGVVPYDFLQARYLAVGILYLVATVVPTSLLILINYLIRNYYYLGQTYNAERRMSWAITYIFGAISMSWHWLWPRQHLSPKMTMLAAFMFVFGCWLPFADTTLQKQLPLRAFRQWWISKIIEAGNLKRIVFIIMNLYLLIVIGAKEFYFYPQFIISVWLLVSGSRPNQKTPVVVMENISGIVFGVGAAVSSMLAFGSHTYPLLTPYVGGGRPALVSMALKSDHRAIIGRVMGREDWKCVMQNLHVIYENNDYIYVLPGGYLEEDPAVAIPKSEIATISFQKKELAEKSKCLE